jgi:hypothetical protein
VGGVTIEDRCAELRALAPGWLDGDGAVIAEPAIETAARVARILAACGREPRIYPRPCGGTSVECDAVDVYIGANGAIESTTEDPDAA